VSDKALLESARAQIAAIKRDRVALLDQIRQSQETIARSQALLRRIDEILARAGPKPSAD
jgi:hypothetical protein